jgi:hypothetical protein
MRIDSTDGGVYGTTIGSINRQKPFNDALLLTLRGNPLALRRIAAKLVERAEEGELAAIREIADRLDGKPAQMLDRRDLPVEELTDEELRAALARFVREEEDDLTLLLPPPRPKSTG